MQKTMVVSLHDQLHQISFSTIQRLCDSIEIFVLPEQCKWDEAKRGQQSTGKNVRFSFFFRYLNTNEISGELSRENMIASQSTVAMVT